MDIADFLTPDRVILDLRLRDKAHLVTEVARLLGRLVPGQSSETIERALLAREQLGSTGLGSGFALPHARIEHLPRFAGLFVRLAKPIDFDAIDGKPVRLVFALLIPSESAATHVAALAAISRRFRDAELVARLNSVKTPIESYHVLTDR